MAAIDCGGYWCMRYTKPGVDYPALAAMLDGVAGTSGYTANGDMFDVIFLEEPSGALQNTIDSLVAGHAQLSLDVSGATLRNGSLEITANGMASASIVCDDAVIASDSALDYAVWLDGAVVASGEAAVDTGSVTLNFSTDEDGEYVIEVKRKTGYASGFVRINGV